MVATCMVFSCNWALHLLRRALANLRIPSAFLSETWWNSRILSSVLCRRIWILCSAQVIWAEISANHFFASDVTSIPVNLAYTFFFYQLVFAHTASTIVSSAIARTFVFIPNVIGPCIYSGASSIRFWALGMGNLFYRNRPAGWEDWGLSILRRSTVVHSIGGWFAPGRGLGFDPRNWQVQS